MRMKNEHKWHGKRFLAALLTLVMLLSVLPISALAKGDSWTKEAAEKVYNSKTSFDHIDIRVAGTITYKTYENGIETGSVTKDVTVANPRVEYFNAAGKSLGSKAFTNTEKYEWRWTKISVPKDGKVVLTCDITIDGVTKKDQTFTFQGKEAFVQAIFVCDGRQGLDFIVSGTDITETFYYQVDYQWTGAPAGAELPTDSADYAPNAEVTVDTSYKAGDQITVDGQVYTFSGWTTEDATVSDGKFNITQDTTFTGSWSVEPVEEEAEPLVSFFVRLDGTIVDNASGAQSWPAQSYSSELRESEIVDSGDPQMSSDSDTWVYEGHNIPSGYADVNAYIESMATEGGTYYVQSFLGSPADVEALKADLQKNTGKKLTINGQDVTQDFIDNTSKYDIFWYVLKNHHKDGSDNWDLGGGNAGERYHIDGVVVLKPENVETLTITKTFNAETAADLAAVTASGAFHLDITDADDAPVVSGLTTEGVLVDGDYLDSYGYLVSVTSADNTVSSGVSKTYTWTLKLPKGETYTVTEDYSGARGTYTVANDGSLAKDAVLTSAQTVVFANTYAKRAPGVTITKSADKSAYQVGDTVTYTITVANASTATKDASNVVVTDVLPTGLTLTSASVTAGTLVLNSDETTKTDPITWNVGTLEAGDSATLTVKATINNDVLNNADGTKKDSVTIENTAFVDYDGNGDPVPSETVVITVTEKTYNYQVRYEYMLKTDGASSYTSQGTSAAVTFQAAAKPSDETVFAIALESIAGSGVSLTYTSAAGTFTYAKHTSMQTGDVTEEGTFTSGNLVYTVKVYYERWTTGSLTINKVWAGDTVTAPSGMEFTVTAPSETEFTEAMCPAGATLNEGKTVMTIPYTALTNNSITLSGLVPGVYTVAESGADVTGFTRTTTITVSSVDSNTGMVGVRASGTPSTVTFQNSYSGKLYRIIFEAENGFVKGGSVTLDEANKTNGGNIWWLVEQNGKLEADWQSSTSLIANQGDDYKLVYLFGNGDQVKGEAISVVPKTGYAWKDQYFVLVNKAGTPIRDGAGELITCTTFAEAKALLNNSYVKAEEITYNQPVPESDATVTEVTNDAYTIRLRATCVYDLTYTFNDFGSKNVSMAYWTEGSQALSSVTKFGASSKPELVTEQANLTAPSAFKPVIFFVKADDGYQINPQALFTESATKLTSVETSEPRTIEAMDDGKPGFVTDETWAAAQEAGYTHFFLYTDSSIAYLNRYFKVVATKNPVYTINGTKTVVQGQGGNQTPGSKEFTFVLQDATGAVVKKTTATVSGFNSVGFDFGAIQYTEPGTYTYTVKEEAAESDYWTYDTTVYTVQIVVAENDNETPNNTSDDYLEITSVVVDNTPILKGGDMAEALAFTNIYTRYVGGRDNGKDPKPPVVIVDPEVPLTPMPEEPEIEIPEEEVPLADIPETGDASALWLALTALSGTGLAGVAVLGRKKREDEE